MEWENFESKVQRCMHWMKREIWLIVSMLFLVFLVWTVSIVEWESMAQPFFWPPSKLFGKWVYDPKPRNIPWSYVGAQYTTICEARHMLSGSDHVANELAEDIAMRGHPGNWSVREELKWVWQTNSSCPWRPINRDDFCRTIGAKRNIMLVGDSISHEIQWALMNALIVNGSGYERLDADSRISIAPYEMCSDIFGQGSGFTVSLIVNVYLTTIKVEPVIDSIVYPWIDLLDKYDTKILLFNRGAHYQDDEAYTSQLREIFTILSENTQTFMSSIATQNRGTGRGLHAVHRTPF